MQRMRAMPTPGVVPGAYHCLRCHRGVRNRLRGLMPRPMCCPHCLSFRIIPSGCIRLPGDPPQ